MTPVPDQPIGFDRQVDCNLADGPFVQLAQNGDVTQFQFQLTDCAATPELIWNGAFTEDGGSGEGWAATPSTAWLYQPYFANVLHIAGTSAGGIKQNIVVADGVLIQIQVTITQATGTAAIYIGGLGGITWTLPAPLTGFINGIYSYWVIVSGMEWIIFAASVDSNATFGNISVRAYNTEFATDVLDQNGVSVTTNIPYNVFNGWATFSFDWQAYVLKEGCYTFDVYTPCDCSQNGVLPLDFITGASGSACYQYGMGQGVGTWASVGNSLTVLNGSIIYIGDSVPDTNIALLATRLLCVDREYIIDFTLSAMSNAEVRVMMGNTAGTWQSADGYYSDTLTVTASGTLSFQFRSVGSPGVAAIDKVMIRATTKEAQYTSQPIHYMGECCKTKLITICNDSDAFGMGFVGTGFSPSIRVHSSLTRSNYAGDRNKYIDSNGRAMNYYGTSRKVSDLRFGAPDFVHDFVRLGIVADHIFVDGVEYFAESDQYPSMSRDESIDMSGVSIPVSLKIENTRNRRVDDSSRGCGLSGAILEGDQKPTGDVITSGSKPKPDLSTSDSGEVLTTDG